MYMEVSSVSFSLPFHLPKVVSLIGGGGKTTLLYLLGLSLAQSGAAVLLTTTTHLGFPPPDGVPFFSPASKEELCEAAEKGKAILAAFPALRGKVQGIPNEWFRPAMAAYDYILIEADGSRNLPLKWHHSHEPCIPPETELLIQLSGLSALGKRAEDVLHRQPSSFLAKDRIITAEDIAALQMRAYAHTGFPGRKISLLNQADTAALEAEGRHIAALLAEEKTAAYTCALQRHGLQFNGKDVFPC